jgi:predicted AAA+ superfamily ATPase
LETNKIGPESQRHSTVNYQNLQNMQVLIILIYLCIMKNLIERRQYNDKLLSYKDKDIIKVVTGLRRSGKSTLLELFRNRLQKEGVLPEQIQFFNILNF